MDAAGIGALIGISIMICLGATIKLSDTCKQKQSRLASTTPNSVRNLSPHPPLLVRRQSKMNMILPK